MSKKPKQSLQKWRAELGAEKSPPPRQESAGHDTPTEKLQPKVNEWYRRASKRR